MRSLLLLAALAAASPAWAQCPTSSLTPDGGCDRTGWGGIAGVHVEAFRSDRDPWRRAEVAIQRRFATGAASLEVGVSDRNGSTDPFVTTDLYKAVGALGYGNLRASVAPGADGIARADVLGEGYAALGGGWEASLGARHLVFEANSVTLGTGSVARYLGNWLLRGRAVVSTHATTAVSTSLAARYLIEGVGGLTAPFVEVTVGQGQEPVVAPDGEAGIRQSFVVAARGQRAVVRGVGLSLGASYTSDGGLTRWGGDLGVVARF